MARTTKATVNNVFALYCKALNTHGIDTERLFIEHSYGGYLVCERMQEGTGLHTPFGYRRRPADEMVETLRFAMDTLDKIGGAR